MKSLNLAFARDLFFIIVGSLMLAVGYSLFLAPVNIVPGGVYGLGIAINHVSKSLFPSIPGGIEIGTIALFFNVPLFLLALGHLGRMTAIKTVEVLEYPELGMEAIWKIEVEDFPAFILVDDKGNDFFEQIKQRCGDCAIAK